MTLTQLSYIVAVDKYRHFATAAQKIYITQPTLSMQIQKLEDELGVRIFDRSKSPVIPTQVGEKIIEQAKVILSGAKHIEDIVAMNQDQVRGDFTIGIIPTVAPYLIPLFLKNFTDTYPDVKLTFEEALTADIISGLNEDHFDAGIIATPPQNPQVHEIELFLEPFQAYVSINHPLAKKEKLHVDDLDSGDLWLLNEGHCFREQSIKICKKSNEKLRNTNISFESGNLETLKRLVEQEYGMTLMPYLAVNEHDTQCSMAVLKEFKSPVPSRRIRLIYTREILKQNVISAFADEIIASVPEDLKAQKEEMVVE
jgi:LysR family hydrogen peroxide-inducible transcriptional activator